MAKRKKKLNRAVVLTLVGLAVLMFGVLAFAGYKYRGKLFPKDPYRYEALGDKALAEGDIAKAENNYGVAVGSSMEPKYPSADRVKWLYKISKLQFDWCLNPVGLTDSMRAERWGSALHFLNGALDIDPVNRDSLKLLSEMRWIICTNTHRWQDYIDVAEKLLKVSPDDHLTYFRTGFAIGNLAQNQRELRERAEACFKRAVELKPDGIDYWIGMAGFYYSVIKDSDKAYAAFDEALAKNPNNARLRVAYSELLADSDVKTVRDRAVQVALDAIRAEPGNPMGRINLARFYLRQKLYGQAVAELEQARALDDSDIYVYLTLAETYNRQLNPEKAAESLRGGLAAMERKLAGPQAASQPAQQQNLKIRKHALLAMLGNICVDMCSQTDLAKEKKDPLIAEAVKCRDQLQPLSEELRLGQGITDKLSGRIAFADGKYEKAMELLEKVRKDSPVGLDDLQLADTLIRTYTALGEPGKAEEILDHFLAKSEFKTNPGLLILKAKYEMTLRRDFDKARALVAEAMKDPGASRSESIKRLSLELEYQSTIDQARHRWVEGQRDESLRLMKDLYQRFPKDPDLISKLLQMYMSMKQIDDAKHLLDVAIKDMPDQESLKRQRALLDMPPEKLFDERLKQIEAAGGTPLEQALEKYGLCQAFGKTAESMNYLKAAVAIDAKDPRVIEGMFSESLETRDWTAAAQWAAAAKEKSVDQVGGALYIARLDLAQNKSAEAVALLLDIVRQKPQYKRVRDMLGQAYLDANDPIKAEEVFQSLVRSDPSYPGGPIGMARVTEMLGKTDEHREMVARAYRLVPENPYIRMEYLAIREEKEDPAKIIAQREELLRTNPQDARNILRLAGLYERTSQFEKAEKLYTDLANKLSNKLLGAQVLAGYYIRNNDLARATSVFEALLKAVKSPQDQVSAWLLYAQYLSSYFPEQAEPAIRKANELAPDDPRPYQAFARYFAGREQWVRAAEECERYVRLSPNDSQAMAELIRLQIQANDFQKASANIENLLARNAQDADALTLKAVLCRAQDDLTGAEGLLNQALQLNPQYYQALLARAGVLLAMANVGGAEADLKTYRRESKSPEAGMRLARFYLAIGAVNDAAGALTEILRDYPEYGPAIDSLIELYRSQKNWDKLQAQLEYAKQMYPRNPNYLLSEGQMWQDRQQVDKALQCYAKAVALSPSMPGIMRLYWLEMVKAGHAQQALDLSDGYQGRSDYQSWLRPVRGLALAKVGRAGEAEAEFIAALKDGKNSQDLMFVFEQMRDAFGADSAVANWTEWTEKYRPQSAALYLVLAEYYTAQEQATAAEEMLRKAVASAQTAGEKLKANQGLGTALYQQGRLKEAEQCFLSALTMEPKDLYANNNLAYMYAEDLDQPSQGLKFAQAAYQAAPGDPRVADTYGWTLAKLGQYPQARELLQISTRLANPPPVNLYHLGWVYERLGRAGDAQSLYKQAKEGLKSNPNPKLQKQLEEALQKLSGH